MNNLFLNLILIIVGDTTNSTDQYFNMQASQITVGVDIYEPGNNSRYFNGDLDEIRVGDIPEPYLFTTCYLLFAFIICHFKQ